MVQPDFTSRQYSCKKVLSTFLVLFQKFATHCCGYPLTSSEPTWQLQLFQYSAFTHSPTPTWSGNSFNDTSLLATIKLMHCTLSGVCAVCGMPMRGKSLILACPLSLHNLLAHRLSTLRSTASFPYTFFNLLQMFATDSFSDHRNSVTACYFRQVSNVAAAILRE